jgi:hypothetical protein
MARSGSHSPYTIQNCTGYPIYVWMESEGDGKDTELHKLANGESEPWKFEDWRALASVC